MKCFYESESDESKKYLLVASNGSVNNFMCGNGISLLCKTTTQQDPERLIHKLILYIFYTSSLSVKYKCLLSSIIAMDETFVWNDMVSNATIDKQGAKPFCLETTWHEECMISVHLAAKADRAKLKPFVVFRAAKREPKSLDKEFKFRCLVKSFCKPRLTKN